MAKLSLNLPGESAYQMWLAQGNSGSKQDFLDSFKAYTPVKGTDYDDGNDGNDGKSAYQSALDGGFVGTEAVWLASLSGLDGYTPVKGTDYDDGNDGNDGKSAYQSALDGGFVGTEAVWLASLKGAKGDTPQFVTITQAAYDALTQAEKDNPLKVYVIPSATS